MTELDHEAIWGKLGLSGRSSIGVFYLQNGLFSASYQTHLFRSLPNNYCFMALRVFIFFLLWVVLITMLVVVGFT